MVSAIGLGCMRFGGVFGAADEAASQRCLDAAFDAGMIFPDTANIYGKGLCAEVMGRFFNRRRVAVTVATKAAIVDGGARSFDNSEAHLRAEREGSLKRMGVEGVDLFYIRRRIHRREQERPVEAVVEGLSRLIAEGKIGGYRLLEGSPATLRRAHAVHPCCAVQNEYSL